MADIIDGKAFAAKIRAEVKEDADKLITQKQVDPCLAVVLVGENPASKVKCMSAKNPKWPLSVISKPKISN